MSFIYNYQFNCRPVAQLSHSLKRWVEEKTGVPTPVNRLLTETLLALTNGEMTLEKYAHQPEKLLAKL